MPKKFYAVKEGKVPGIYETWVDCKEQVDGHSGAIYKSFKNRSEAEQFLGTAVHYSQEMPAADTSPADPAPASDDQTLIAYVDGSYNDQTSRFSYGVVMLHQGEEITFSGSPDDKELAAMRNVAGEIKGAEAAMRYAADHGFKKVIIYHDYEGIARWCTGEWQAKKEGTKAYKACYEQLKGKISIEFIKVKGHSGDKYNDMADELAKREIF